jgi:SpoVK/Ycf46/Vps4 family AAA+-type ATPase
LLGLASSVVSGDGIGAPSLGGLDLAALRARTRQRLDTAKQMFTDRKAALEAKLKDQTTEVGKAETALAEAVTTRGKAQDEIAHARDMRAQCGAADQPCADADRALQDAYTGKDSADIAHAAATSALAEAKAKQAKLVAAQDVLGETAADSFERILDDYNQDLLVLQQVASKGAGGETAKP